MSNYNAEGTGADRRKESIFSKQNSQHSASNSGGTEGEESRLLRELNNITEEGFGFNMYQNDYRKFETQPNVNEKEGTKKQQGPNTNKRHYGRHLSRLDSLRANRKKKKELPRISKRQNVNVVFKRRIICRILSLFCMFFVVGFLAIFGYIIAWTLNTINIDPNLPMKIDLKNCRLYLDSCENCSGTEIRIDHRLSLSQLLFKNTASTSMLKNSTGVYYNLEQIPVGMRGCNLYISQPRGIAISNLEIGCAESCVVIQKSTMLIDNLKISGEQLYSNFEDIRLKKVNISAQDGFVQLNKVGFSGDGPFLLHISYGDIIIQTSETLDASYLTASEAYCFSAESHTELEEVTKSIIEEPLKNYRTDSHAKAGLFSYQWKGKVRLCGSVCGSPVQVSLSNFEGNIYINILDEIPAVSTDEDDKLFRGSPYSKWLNFSYYSIETMKAIVRETQERSLPNLIIKLNIGNTLGQAVQSQTWVYTDHKIFGVVKPWWLSVFTITKLVENSHSIDTFLSPGTCPFRHTTTPRDNYHIKQLIERSLSDLGSISWVVPFTQEQNYVLDPNIPQIGFKNYSQSPNFSDEWIDVKLEKGFEIRYYYRRLTETFNVFYLVIVSVTGACILAFYIVLQLIKLVNSLQLFIINKILHINLYWRISNNMDFRSVGINDVIPEEDDQELLREQSSLLAVQGNVSLLNLSSLTAFIDFFIIEMSRNQSSTLQRFYNLLFEETIQDDTTENEFQNMNKDKISMKKLKSIFQQFCLMNNFREADLSSERSITAIKAHGFLVTTSEKYSNFYLIRISLKEKPDHTLNISEISERENSLKLFIQYNCDMTEFEEDKIQFDVFLNRYDLFCKMYHIEKTLIDHIVLKNDYGISSKRVVKEMIERDPDYSPQLIKGSFNRYIQFMKRITSFFSRRRYYKFNYRKIEKMNKFLSGQLTLKDGPLSSWYKIVNIATLPPRWYLFDFLSIFLQILVNALISIPFISIFIFQEIEHSVYSTRDESINVYGFNMDSNDVWLLPSKIFSNTILLIVIILFILFWVSTLGIMILSTIYMKFPWINTFRPNTKITITNIIISYQWIFLFVAVGAIVAYICVAVVWDIMASIIKPDAYLVSTSMAISLVYLVYTLYKEFKNIRNNSILKFNIVFKQIWEERVRLITKKMLKTTSPSDPDDYDSSSILFSKSKFPEKLKMAEQAFQRLITDQPSCKSFIRFMISYLQDNPSKLRESMEDFCQGPLMSLNNYWTDLIGNVMFQTVGFKNDKFNIQKNIRLCCSLVFYNTKKVLVSLNLRNINPIRPRECDCDEETLIGKEGICLGCMANGRSHIYDRNLREKILRIQINENAKLMVEMLKILSNLQKRRTDNVLKIIENIFLETFSAPVFESVKPIFDFINLLVFNLDDTFDYSQLIEIFLDFLKKSMKADMRLAEILMIYLLKDEILTSSERGEAHDSRSITNLFKRQINSAQDNSKETKMLVKHLSLATAFYSRETLIDRTLLKDLLVVVNKGQSSSKAISRTLVSNIINIPFYFRYKPIDTLMRIKKHALDYRISTDLSNILVYFELISKSVNVDTSGYWEESSLIKTSATFERIKQYFSVSSKELLGIIYLMKGNMRNDNLSKVLSLMLKKNNLEEYQAIISEIIMMMNANDPQKFKKSVRVFYRYIRPQQDMFNIFVKLFAYMNGLLSQSDLLFLEFERVYETFPIHKLETQATLKSKFLRSVTERDYMGFKIFKDSMLSLLRRKNNDKKLDDDSLITFYIVEIFFALNFESNKLEVLQKLKRFYIELENQQLSNFMLLFLKTIQGFASEKSEIMNEKIQYSFNLLGELIIERPSSLEKLWNLVYSQDYIKKIESYTYFLGEATISKLNLEERLKCHMMFISKYIEFIKNQDNFINSVRHNSWGLEENDSILLGMSSLKVCILKNMKFQSEFIKEILVSLFQKMGVDVDRKGEKNNAVTENTRDLKLFNALHHKFIYLINNDATSLSKEYLDEGEPMISSLISSLTFDSNSKRLNIILTELVDNGNKRLAGIYYYYFMLIGGIKRKKITYKTVLDNTINEWISIKPQFMEFIDLYVYRNNSDLVEKIFKIQNRILLNFKAIDSTVLRKSSDIISQDMIKNFTMLIDNETPYLKSISKFFKIPNDKLYFFYILNSLKCDLNFDKNLDLLKMDREIIVLLNQMGVDPEELCFLLKVCLNKMDYDSITEFLKLIRLDKIIPEVLFNLLLIDKPVKKEMVTLREFNKEYLVHSRIFDLLKVSRELSWAFFRVLQGDFLTFKKMLETLYDDYFPENHKYFMNVLVGLVGLKNVKFSYEDIHIEWRLGFCKYRKKLKNRFEDYGKGQKEITLEYTQYVLHKQFKLNPLWVPLLSHHYLNDEECDKYNLIDSQKYKQQTDHKFDLSNIDNLDESDFSQDEDTSSHYGRSQFDLMQILVLHALLTVDETILLFIYDFAIFRNIYRFLNDPDLRSKINLHSFFNENIAELKDFFECRNNEYLSIMRDLFKNKIISFSRKNIIQPKYRATAAYQNMIIFFRKSKYDFGEKDPGFDFNAEEEFNLSFNIRTLEKWKEDLQRMTPRPDDFPAHESRERSRLGWLTQEKIDSCIIRLNSTIPDREYCRKSIFEMFVTKENRIYNAYWEKKFDEIEYLDSYLNSLVDMFMDELTRLKSILDIEFDQTEVEDMLSEQFRSTYTTLNDNELDINDLDMDVLNPGTPNIKDNISLDGERFSHRSEKDIHMNVPEKNRSIGINWGDGLIQCLLLRMRGYIWLSSDEKTDKLSEIMYKSDLVFNILEKIFFLDPSLTSSNSFRKYSYLNDFNLSNGIIMILKAFIKSSASLFIPELSCYMEEMTERAKTVEGSTTETEFDKMIIKCKMVKLVFENDRQFFPLLGNFRQFDFDKDSEGDVLKNNKFNLYSFRSTVQILENIFRYKVPEVANELVEQYYILMFAVKKEYNDPNQPEESRTRRIKYITHVFKEHLKLVGQQSFTKGKKQGARSSEGEESFISFSDDKGREDKNKNVKADPTLISMVLLEEGALYTLAKRTTDQMKDLFNRYYSKTLESYKRKSTTKIKNGYSQILDHFKFMNDLALGKYSVLSETKNVFSDNYDLTNYQKIYESMLFLHASKRNYKNNRLSTDLKVLSSNLKSNVNNLSHILDFVLNQDDESEFPLFKQLDISNQTFFYIFNLHRYNHETRRDKIDVIVNEYLLVPDIMKDHISNIINLIYLIKLNEKHYMTKDNFELIAKGIMVLGDHRDQSYESLIKITYDIIHSDLTQTGLFPIKRKSTSPEKYILRLYRKFNEIEGKKSSDMDDLMLRKANKFILNVYKNESLEYLASLDPESPDNKQFIANILGVKNVYNLKIFKIIKWIQGSIDVPFQEIDEHIVDHYCQGLLADTKIVESVEKVKNVFTFMRAFSKGNSLHILNFLLEFKMEAEYAYFFSNYLYISIINGWIDQESYTNDRGLMEYLSVVLCYPLLQFIIIEFQKMNSSSTIQKNSFSEILVHLRAKRLELQEYITDKKHSSLMAIVKQKGRPSDDTLDRLMRGELFENLYHNIQANINSYSQGPNDTHLSNKTLTSLMNLYLFSNRFYENMDDDSNQKLQGYITSAINLRRRWKKIGKEFHSEMKKNTLLNIAPKELIDRLKNVCSLADFSFLNLRDKKSEEMLRNIIFPLMIFMFFYLVKVRSQIKRNDNTKRIFLLKICLSFIWYLCQTANGKPFQSLKFDPRKEIEFIEDYTHAIFHLRIKRSNLFVLSELLTFMKKFIFSYKDKNELKSHSEDKSGNSLLTFLRLDSFMELYDYMEDLLSGRKYSENNKENIINLLLVQIVSVNSKFKSRANDVKTLIKLLQGEADKMDYFISKVFFRDDNASFASNIFQNLYKEKEELGLKDEERIRRVRLGELSLLKVDRNKLLKRAEEGHASFKDLLLLLEKDSEKSSLISLPILKIIFRRLGLNLTPHRVAEFTSAAKMYRLKNSVGTVSFSMNSVNHAEFTSIMEYMQTKIFEDTEESLKISPRNLVSFSLISGFIFLFNINYISNIVVNVFGGGILAAALCGLIPLATVVVISQIKTTSVLNQDKARRQIEESFMNVTNSKPEFLS